MLEFVQLVREHGIERLSDEAGGHLGSGEGVRLITMMTNGLSRT